ncbi:MAG: homocysteine S-methyltransferase family protein [Kiritimatiellae bacterium]|nr:homocysteine S-methyltransferase family protein [Kiritimatiellia bacterium]
MKLTEMFDDLLLLDGAMGTQLQARGLQPGETPELWNLTRPDDVRAIHAAYFKAGAQVVYANTFGANRAKYHGDAPLADVIAAGVARVREAADAPGLPPGRRFVALDIGPTGRLLKPAGDFEFDAAYDAFAEQVRIGAAAGADLVVIETMADAYELKAAVLAAKENADLPILATVALGNDGKLLTGADVDCVAAILQGLRIDALGFNCGFGPEKMLPHVRRLASLTSLPIVAKPNAGMPRVVDGRTVYDLGPEDFAKGVVALIEAGASIVGGCCGSTPAHIAALSAATRNRAATAAQLRVPSPSLPQTVVTSGSRAVPIPFGDSIVIGERINPTGKKKLRAALTDGDTAYVLREAVSQAEAGAHVLDVNVGVPGLDEPAVLDATMQAVQSVTDLPLQLDTSDPKALERAMRHYNGKPLVNSVNGKEESLAAVLPIVAKYGGVVVALTLDEDGIPPTAEGRLAIARKILARGGDYGLKPSDFLIDVLCLAVSAEAQSGNVILESLRRVRDELGCRTCLGVSNISFGLPSRPLLNATFYTLALKAGLSAGIVNPLSDEMMTAYRAFRALTARDGHCAEWVEVESQRPTVAGPAAKVPVAKAQISQSEPSPQGLESSFSCLRTAIRRGLKADAAEAAKTALGAGEEPLRLIDSGIVPALEEVGKGFEAGKVFLPQLLMAADAAGAAFDVIRANFPAQAGAAKGPIVMATVKGDIHDIGKNICRALLENYGFKVIDLGRDVAPGKVLEAAQKSKAPLVGLSALMTTTVGAMEETIALLHRELPSCKVAVGGAVLTADYAAKIGADYYTKDAMELVRLAEKVLG